MKRNSHVFRIGILCLGLVIVLACNLISNFQREQVDLSGAETGTAFHLLSASLTSRPTTLESLPTDTLLSALSSTPSQTVQPSTPTMPPSPMPSETAGTPMPLALEIQTSVDTFYCYDSPFELTITVRVSDIERGMAVYYHIQDKKSGVTSEGQVLDLHRKTDETRSATIIGGGSDEQNLQFPPLMGESYFIYQIVSDDGSYRSPVYSSITFFPCAQ